MMNRAEYRTGVLARLGSYQLGAWRAFGAWELAESGTNVCNGISGQGAKWNPYNTTMPAPNSTCYNQPACVRNYPTYLSGVQATVKTLNLNAYGPIRAAITTDGVSARQVMEAIATTPWGTSLEGLLNALEEYQLHRSYYNGLPIGV